MNNKQQTGRRSLSEVFRVPLLLGLLSAVGLLSALIEDGWFDLVSSVALAIPLIVIGWHANLRLVASRFIRG